ncbi:MAG: hypothetical protein K6U11_00695 [bacterium]|nr:hypothetical protein [bacterium]
MKNFAYLCNLVQYLRPPYHHQAYCLLHYNLISCPLRGFPFQGVTRPLGIIIAVSPCRAYHHAGRAPRGAFPQEVGPQEWSGPRVFSLMALFLCG